MPTEVGSNRAVQMLAWIVAGLFILGFFTSIGEWTGPMLGTWFVLTQKPRRGFVWMFLFEFVPSLIAHARAFPFSDPHAVFNSVLGLTLACILEVLPFTLHRLVSPRLTGLLSTLPLPFGAIALHGLIAPFFPAILPAPALLHTFLVCWLASTVVWMWNQEFRFSRVAVPFALFAAIFVPLAGLAVYRQFAPIPILTTNSVTPFALCGAAVFVLLAAVAAGARKETIPWADRAGSLAHLQSPFTGERLYAVRESGREFLCSHSGERFAVREGIPVFLNAEDLTGDNGKYNHLYETIGGFYDDTQRFFGAFRGMNLDSYFRNYMDLLDVKPGDSVLETSVGTGLNFKYLPRGVKLSGLDLSQEMLTNCQRNILGWGMEADLFLGNAERLPFADASFDVVFTAGAFNFFTDRPKAIHEMIRVAKPGAHLMIEDETEEYVKGTYENIPFTSSFYKDRKEAVTVPIDLVPQEMEDVRVEMLKEGKFYAITFRKPGARQEHDGVVFASAGAVV